MITEKILDLIFDLVYFIIDILPNLKFDYSGGFDTFLELLSYAMYFFPHDVWVVICDSIIFWIAVGFLVAVVEWVYKKFPGIN